MCIDGYFLNFSFKIKILNNLTGHGLFAAVELKEAMIAMMTRKDEVEQQNRSLSESLVN